MKEMKSGFTKNCMPTQKVVQNPVAHKKTRKIQSVNDDAFRTTINRRVMVVDKTSKRKLLVNFRADVIAFSSTKIFGKHFYLYAAIKSLI